MPYKSLVVNFKLGDQVICLNAPWHSKSISCELYGFGPRMNEMVTIQCYIILYSDFKYVALKEYLDDRIILFREDFFGALVSDEQLYTDLKDALLR